MVRGREDDHPPAPRPQMSDNDIDWVHDKRAEERLLAGLVGKQAEVAARRLTWAKVIAAIIATMVAILGYFKGGVTPP